MQDSSTNESAVAVAERTAPPSGTRPHNDLPRWWMWLFYLCILYFVAYLGYYHVFKMGDLQATEYAKEHAIGEN